MKVKVLKDIRNCKAGDILEVKPDGKVYVSKRVWYLPFSFPADFLLVEGDMSCDKSPDKKCCYESDKHQFKIENKLQDIIIHGGCCCWCRLDEWAKSVKKIREEKTARK